MRRALRVVAIVGCVLAAAVSLSACGGSRLRLTATFDDVGDLVKGHAVQMADVRVGHITSIKLTSEDAYRIRVGDYRIIYAIYDDRLLVLVIDVGHRREVYRRQ